MTSRAKGWARATPGKVLSITSIRFAGVREAWLLRLAWLRAEHHRPFKRTNGGTCGGQIAPKQIGKQVPHCFESAAAAVARRLRTRTEGAYRHHVGRTLHTLEQCALHRRSLRLTCRRCRSVRVFDAIPACGYFSNAGVPTICPVQRGGSPARSVETLGTDRGRDRSRLGVIVRKGRSRPIPASVSGRGSCHAIGRD